MVVSDSSIPANEWYVWTIKTGKFDIVSHYLETRVPEVVEILYPTVTTERRDKKGDVRKKQTPLYAGYLFLCYHHDVENPATWWKINKHPFVTGYVGPCTAQDLASVASMKKVRELNAEETKSISVGDTVFVNGGVFRGFRGRVVGISNTAIRVDVLAFDRTIKVVFSPDDLDITNRPGLGER